MCWNDENNEEERGVERKEDEKNKKEEQEKEEETQGWYHLKLKSTKNRTVLYHSHHATLIPDVAMRSHVTRTYNRIYAVPLVLSTNNGIQTWHATEGETPVL